MGGQLKLKLELKLQKYICISKTTFFCIYCDHWCFTLIWELKRPTLLCPLAARLSSAVSLPSVASPASADQNSPALPPRPQTSLSPRSFCWSSAHLFDQRLQARCRFFSLREISKLEFLKWRLFGFSRAIRNPWEKISDTYADLAWRRSHRLSWYLWWYNERLIIIQQQRTIN